MTIIKQSNLPHKLLQTADDWMTEYTGHIKPKIILPGIKNIQNIINRIIIISLNKTDIYFVITRNEHKLVIAFKVYMNMIIVILEQLWFKRCNYFTDE